MSKCYKEPRLTHAGNNHDRYLCDSCGGIYYTAHNAGAPTEHEYGKTCLPNTRKEIKPTKLPIEAYISSLSNDMSNLTKG